MKSPITAPDLDAFWMPFTPNRQFKAAPRMVVSTENIRVMVDRLADAIRAVVPLAETEK